MANPLTPQLLESVHACKACYAPEPSFPGSHLKIFHQDNNAYLYSSATGEIVIAIEGTDALADWKTNLNALPDSQSIPGVTLHSGFSGAAAGLWRQIRPRLSGNDLLWLTGHSLGGAVATVMSLFALAEGYKVARLDTFGAPRFGKKDAAYKLARLLPERKVTRVFLGNDLVTRLSLSKLGWWHPLGMPLHLTREGAIAGVTEWQRVRAAQSDTEGRVRALLEFTRGQLGGVLGSVSDHSIEGYTGALERELG